MNKVAVKEKKPVVDKQKVLEKLTGARIALLLKQPFFGNMATRMQLQEADWCPTAATDGKHFYYNPEFIAQGEIIKGFFLSTFFYWYIPETLNHTMAETSEFNYGFLCSNRSKVA